MEKDKKILEINLTQLRDTMLPLTLILPHQEKTFLPKAIRKYCEGKGAILSTIAGTLERITYFENQLLREVNPDKITTIQNNLENNYGTQITELEFALHESHFKEELKKLLENYPFKRPEQKSFALFMFLRYFTRIAEEVNSFDLEKDLPELLAVDLAVCSLTLSLGIEIGQTEQRLKEEKRAGKHKKVTNSKKTKRWENIQAVLAKLQHDKEYENKSFSISGIAGLITRLLPSDLTADKQTIIRDFSEHLGNDLTKKKYKISDLLNIYNN
ncbi:MAG: hypothetical protein Q8R88_16330 [Desulfoprunum sp.]|nr:hypothetical protein [Desulfoprunum sp.]